MGRGAGGVHGGGHWRGGGDEGGGEEVFVGVEDGFEVTHGEVDEEFGFCGLFFFFFFLICFWCVMGVVWW